MKKKLTIACAIFALCGVSTSCSVIPLSMPVNESARAQLDYVTGHIILPLEEYIFPNDYDMTLINNFINAVRSECMRKQGYDFKLPQFDKGYPGSEADQRYGFWNIELARKHGSGGSVAESSSVYAEKYRQFPQAFQDLNKAYHNTVEGKPLDDYQKIIMDCVVKTDAFIENLVPGVKDNNSSTVSMARRLASQAAAKVRGTREWDEAIEKYEDCLEENQLTLSSDGMVGSQELVELTAVSEGLTTKTLRQLLTPSEQTKEDIRLTTIEAECNQRLSIAQTLADLEASYQQDLIAKNRPTLEAEKKRRHEAIRTMMAYIQASL